MQTRADFLKKGLVPVISTDPSADDCAICFGELSPDPVQTPCKHVFHRSCIERWLNGEKHNTCPLCKTQFFELPVEEVVGQAELRRRHAATALHASNLISREPPFETFGATEWNVSSLQRAVAQATFGLGHDELPSAGDFIRTQTYAQAPGGAHQVAGPCLMDVLALSPAFVAMANLIPHFAEAQGQGFTRSVWMWRNLCYVLWLEIQALNGRKFDAMVLPALLKRKTRETVHRRMSVIHASFFDEVDIPWWDMMVDWMVLRSWKTWQEMEAKRKAKRETEKKRKEARKKPKMRSGCGTM